MRILLMCNNCSKIKTYIGFAKRSRTVVFGVDEIIKEIKKCECILASSTLSQSSLQKLQKFAAKIKQKVYLLAENKFNHNLDNEFIKAIAITDKNLSDAIKKELD